MRIVNEKNWGEREDKRTKMTQVRASDIAVGERYLYRGANTITRNATYYADVKKITPWIVVLDITIDQRSAPIERYGIARTYSVAIQRKEIGRSERLYVNGR